MYECYSSDETVARAPGAQLFTHITREIECHFHQRMHILHYTHTTTTAWAVWCACVCTMISELVEEMK